MFKRFEVLDANGERYIGRMTPSKCILYDTSFVQEFVAVKHNGAFAYIIPEYEKRRQNVPRNLALCYKWLLNNTSFISLDALKIDREQMDLLFPHLNYGKKYYNCVVNQCRMLKILQS
jgi:hypothetical protein